MRPDPGFDAQGAAKRLLREARSGALATLMPGSGAPCCSLVNVASAVDGTPLLLLSRLAVHTGNILADARVSLMLDERKAGDPLEGARITLAGRAQPTADAAAMRRYLARHPSAELFAGFKDFAFYHVTLAGGHLIAGFGRIVDLAAEQLLTDIRDAAALTQAEPGICAHLNTDHAEAVRLYATRLLGAPDGDWRCVGCDPEGLELQFERVALRLPFARRVTTPGMLRQMLKKLADAARERPPDP